MRSIHVKIFRTFVSSSADVVYRFCFNLVAILAEGHVNFYMKLIKFRPSV